VPQAPYEQIRPNETSDSTGIQAIDSSTRRSPEAMKTVTIDKLDYLMLEQLARRARQRPDQFLRELIRTHYDKIK